MEVGLCFSFLGLATLLATATAGVGSCLNVGFGSDLDEIKEHEVVRLCLSAIPMACGGSSLPDHARIGSSGFDDVDEVLVEVDEVLVEVDELQT